MIGDVADHDAGHGPQCHHKGQEPFDLEKNPEPDVVDDIAALQICAHEELRGGAVDKINDDCTD